MKTFLMIIALHILRVKAYSDYKECILEFVPKTRTFQDLVEYQSNKISFDANHSGFLGNFVVFTNIHKLDKNAFITFQSDLIISLNISGKGIQNVDDGAFTTLFCLHYLDLSQNNIKEVHKATFQGLENLRKLNLSNNKLTFLPEFVFEELKRAKTLDISGNTIKGIDSLALHNLPRLKELYLENNKLTSLPKSCFQDLHQAKVLDLNSNNFKLFTFEVFMEMNSLEFIDLSGNEITDLKFIDAKCESVRFLNLTNNYLDNLDVVSLEINFPYLDEVDLNENKFLCSDLMIILENLKAKNISVSNGRITNSTHQISNIFCENYLTTVIASSPTTTKEEIIPPAPDSWESIKSRHYFAHNTTNWLILLFCIIAGLGVVFVLDFFFARGSLFSACNRAALRGRYVAPPAEYVPLDGH